MGWGAGGSCTPHPPIRQQPASETRVVTVVFLGLLLDLLAFTLLLPLLPGLLESHGRAHVSPPHPPSRSLTPTVGAHSPASHASCPPGPSLWLLAARGGLVCCSHRGARREEIQQRPVRRCGPEAHAGSPWSYLPGLPPSPQSSLPELPSSRSSLTPPYSWVPSAPSVSTGS